MTLNLTPEMAHAVRETLDAIYADTMTQLDEDETFETLHRLDDIDAIYDALPEDA